ncbi:MAG: O-antigen ligase family protein, partial [Bryobacteraceae bacterium]
VLAVLAAAVKALFDGSRARLLGWRESRLFLLLFAWAWLSALTVGRWEWAVNPLTSCLSIAAYLYPTLIFLDSTENVHRAVHWIAFSMLLASYSVFSQFVKYGVMRPGGIVGDPNYYALVAVSLLPLCVALLPEARGLSRWLLAATALALIASTLLGASRGGFLSLTFCLLYMTMKGRRRILLLAGIALLMITLGWILPHAPWDRFLRPGSGDAISTEVRKQTLKAGWAMIQTHPLTGVGVGMFKPLAPTYNAATPVAVIGHNTYLEVAAELGVPALLVFVAILVTAWRRARRTAQWYEEVGDRATARLARAVEVGIASFALGAMFLSAEYVRQLWLLVWFSLALARLAEEGQQSDGESSEEASAEEAGYVVVRG